MAQNTKAVGDIGEQIAVDYLKTQGYSVLERNAVYCGCEADIICECFVDGNDNVIKRSKAGRLLDKLLPRSAAKTAGERVLVFCEVKTRYGDGYGTGAEAVTQYKVGRYITAAKAYCSQHFCPNARVRFDIIEICDGAVNHLTGAFNENDAKYVRKV